MTTHTVQRRARTGNTDAGYKTFVAVLRCAAALRISVAQTPFFCGWVDPPLHPVQPHSLSAGRCIKQAIRLAIVGGEDSGFGDDDIPSGNVPYSQKRSDPQPFLPRLTHLHALPTLVVRLLEHLAAAPFCAPAPTSSRSSPSSSTTPPTKQSSSKPGLSTASLALLAPDPKRMTVSRLSTWGRRGHHPGPEANAADVSVAVAPAPITHPKQNRILRKPPPVTDADAEDVVLGEKVELRRVGSVGRAARTVPLYEGVGAAGGGRVGRAVGGVFVCGAGPSAKPTSAGADTDKAVQGVTVHLLFGPWETAAIGVGWVRAGEARESERQLEACAGRCASRGAQPSLRNRRRCPAALPSAAHTAAHSPTQHSGQLHDVSALGPAFTALTIAVHAVDAGDPHLPLVARSTLTLNISTTISWSPCTSIALVCAPPSPSLRAPPSPSSPHRPLSPAFTLAPPPGLRPSTAHPEMPGHGSGDGWGDTGDVLTGVDAPALPLHALQPKALLEVPVGDDESVMFVDAGNYYTYSDAGGSGLSREDAAHVAAWRWRCAGLEQAKAYLFHFILKEYVAALRVEFAPESGIMARVVDGAAGVVVGVDVVHEDEIKAVKICTEKRFGERTATSRRHTAASLISVLILSWHRW
ncbi:hypothetical protein B0H14DRAFT_2608167 [Mycena olivaceomarginata]|nr:hypothetical protein B0H14DRAFT_2608167 [Mycena olivaceomarginata]